MSIASIALAIVLGILLVTVWAIIARKPPGSAKPATDGGPGSESPAARKTVQTDGGPGSELTK